MPAAAKLCFAQTSAGKLSSSGSLQGMAVRGQHTSSGTSVVLCFLPGQIWPLKFLPSHLSLLACFILFCCLMTITQIMDRMMLAGN